MRVYRKKKLEKVYCNKCGRKILTENGLVKEGIFCVDYKWDYFSSKDGVRHSFDICEECYDKMIKEFKYPIDATEYTELV